MCFQTIEDYSIMHHLAESTHLASNGAEMSESEEEDSQIAEVGKGGFGQVGCPDVRCHSPCQLQE